jgi:hypothetical protein
MCRPLLCAEEALTRVRVDHYIHYCGSIPAFLPVAWLSAPSVLPRCPYIDPQRLSFTLPISS